MSNNKQLKHPVGRPPKRLPPSRIPGTPENIARVIVSGNRKKPSEWSYWQDHLAKRK